MNRFSLLFLLLSADLAFSQSLLTNQSRFAAKSDNTQNQIIWEQPKEYKLPNDEAYKLLTFEGSQNNYEDDFLPRFSKKVVVNNQNNFSAQLINATFENMSEAEIALIKSNSKIANDIIIKTQVVIAKKVPYGVVSFIPIRKNNSTGKYEKLISFDLSINPAPQVRSVSSVTRTYAAHSVLASGDWYKMSINNDGIYKLSYSFLKSLGLDVDAINPKNIRIYGNGGGMLAELNSVARLDDLIENAIFVQGENDDKFDYNDYVLFYGKGPNIWKYDSTSCPKFKHTQNLYSDLSYYFITADLGSGKRIQIQASSSLPVTHNVTTFDDYAYHEIDNVNFLKSGRQWFGEYFENNPTNNFSFSFPNIVTSSNVTVKTAIASRLIDNAPGTTTYAYYNVSSQSGSATIQIADTNGDSYSPNAPVGSSCYSFLPSNPFITVTVTKQTSAAVAWLDYIEVNARRQLTMSGNQLLFRDAQSLGTGNVAQYSISSNSAIQIWDVTDPANIMQQDIIVNGNNYQFALPTDNLKQFAAYNGSSFLSPVSVGKINNQDLHSLSNKDFLIVTHPDFYQEALQLANYHQNNDGLSYVVATTDQVYNEFSSGAQDICAIRDFAKMFYDKATVQSEMPKYLLLFGDGSYDNKMRFSNNTNFVPTYQSYESQVLISSYVSDDFYGCLDNNEGYLYDSSNGVDIGIGRFPVQTRADAIGILNKIYVYRKTGVPPTTSNNGCSNLSSNSPFGDWRNMLCFIADDEDGDLHITQADSMARMSYRMYKNYNVDKIYLDAYKQETTPGGNRYPGVVDAINKRMEKGCLIMNYTGHGGELGLAHERIVEDAQINKWSNINNMPLIFTATCEFARYDDPERTSAGEYTFLNPNGGGIALFTTVRLVFASSNFLMNKPFYDYAFTPVNGKMPTLGMIYEYIKNQSGGRETNGRNFTLLGDPALTLVYPKYAVSTDTINNSAVTPSSTDTLKALTQISISGYVRDANGGILTNYNGVLYPTIYDKVQTFTTLSNDGTGPSQSPPFNFKLQKNILYKGKASVTNGFFKFSFIVPKDIAYQYGIGKISYYAENGNEDAQGYYEKIIIGGSNTNAPTDVTGPDVKLYLNDTKFIFGGTTNENPSLFSILKDNNGINTVGNGIGHDITAVLDGNTENSIVLNDFYQADLNSYKSGTIRYPFSDLAEGKHSLKLKVWDVYNNSAETYTEFIVSKSAELALNHVLNYPNPFTTRTQFYFEQNQCCQQLDVQIQIFTVSGKLVKNISKFVFAEGFRNEPIEWDGRDDYGDKIGRGVYVYKLKVKTNDGKTAEKYEKLVILN